MDALDDYEMLEELGSTMTIANVLTAGGSFGVVFKARHRQTNELVAMKHIDLDGTDDDIRDIQQEIALLSTCSSPYVTKYKTSFVRGVKLWIVMEYLGGGSCLDLLKVKPLTENDAAIVCRELLLGLEYLHATGKIHRDIKAANVLLSNMGRVKIADFGVAAQLSNIKSQRNTFVGTPFWMAPEVIQEFGYDSKADLWSLGITAIELVQGEPPNSELHPMKALFQIPKNPAPRLDRNRFSRDIRSFVACCLVKDPDQRPTAKDLLQHRFIQRAGTTDNLRRLIEQAKQYRHSEEEARHPRFYEETLRDMSPSEADDWIFDTLRPSTAATATVQTISLLSSDTSKTQSQGATSCENNATVSVPEGASLASSTVKHRPETSQTMRKAPVVKIAVENDSSNRKSSSEDSLALVSVARETMKKVAPQNKTPIQKQPLAVDISFGNTQASQRAFRRVSDESEPVAVNNENLQIESTSQGKELCFGRSALGETVDSAFSEVIAQTADNAKQQALSRVSQAWTNLDSLDPEGTYLVLKLIYAKLAEDSKFSQLVCGPRSEEANSEQKAGVARRASVQLAPKLILAQNNPHLKSHQRRQSAQVSPVNVVAKHQRQSNDKLTPRESQMDPSKAVGEALYARWLEGLRSRWPQS